MIIELESLTALAILEEKNLNLQTFKRTQDLVHRWAHVENPGKMECLKKTKHFSFYFNKQVS